MQGGNPSHVKTNNKGEYFYRNTGDWEPDYGKTNHFLYEENIHAVYANTERIFGKNGQYRPGYVMKTPHTMQTQLGNPIRKDSSFSSNYDGLFPSATASIQADSFKLVLP